MPKLTRSNPSYRNHRASGQAIVMIEGKDILFGSVEIGRLALRIQLRDTLVRTYRGWTSVAERCAAQGGLKPDVDWWDETCRAIYSGISSRESVYGFKNIELNGLIPTIFDDSAVNIQQCVDAGDQVGRINDIFGSWIVIGLPRD